MGKRHIGRLVFLLNSLRWKYFQPNRILIKHKKRIFGKFVLKRILSWISTESLPCLKSHISKPMLGWTLLSSDLNTQSRNQNHWKPHLVLFHTLLSCWAELSSDFQWPYLSEPTFFVVGKKLNYFWSRKSKLNPSFLWKVLCHIQNLKSTWEEFKMVIKRQDFWHLNIRASWSRVSLSCALRRAVQWMVCKCRL